MKNKKVLLFGYGKYGKQIASSLKLENYQVIIAEHDDKHLQKAKEDSYKAVKIDLQSDETLFNVFFEEDISEVYLALDNEEDNIYLTITIKSLYTHIFVVAFCEIKENERKLLLSRADKVINVMEAGANKIYHLLEKPNVMSAIEYLLNYESDIFFHQIIVPKNSFLTGKDVKEINFSERYNLIFMGFFSKELSSKFVFATKGIKHIFEEDDILVVVGKADDVEKFKSDLIK